MSPQENQQNDQKWQPLLKWSGLGIEFCGVVALFCYFGFKLDEKFQTSPWFLLGGFFVSFTGMMYIVFKEARRLWRS